MTGESYKQVLEKLTESQRKELVGRLPSDLQPKGMGSKLVAFVRIGEGYVQEEVIRSLQDKLPSSMVPSSVIEVGNFPRTPHGKVDRRKLLEINRAGVPRISTKDEPSPMSETERKIAEIWSEVLQVDQVGVHDDFFALGGDSIQGIQMVSKSVRAGLPMTMQLFVENRSVSNLAAAVDSIANNGLKEVREENDEIGSVLLTPIQHWFFEKESPCPAQWNLECLVRVSSGTSLEGIEQAMKVVIRRHGALRTAFPVKKGQRAAVVIDQPDEQAVFEVESVEEAARFHETLNLETGLLFKGGFVRNESLLLLVAHHLVMDQISWRTIADELSLLLAGKELPPAPVSIGHWTRRLASSVKKGEWNDEIDYWKRTGGTGRHQLPRDHETNEGIVEGGMEIFETGLDVATTRRLFQAISGSEHGIEDLLVTGLARSLVEWAGTSESWRIGMEHHGRTGWEPGPDVSRSVGWFTAYYPVVLPALERDSTLEDLSAVAETLAGIPRSGRGYGVLRYLGGVKELREQSEPEILFNYLGAVDSTGESGIESVDTGNTRNRDAPRGTLLEINVYLEDEALRVKWQFSPKTHDRSTINGLASNYDQEVVKLLNSLSGNDEQSTDEKPEELSRFPLAANQRAILRHHLQYPDRDAGALRIQFRLESEFDFEAFEKAWNEVIKRHAMLQSALFWDDNGQPWCSLDRNARLCLESVLDGDEECDIQKAPAMRVGVRQVSGGLHEVTWLCHHLFLDGWSSAIILSELIESYDALCGGTLHSKGSGPSFHGYATWLQHDLVVNKEKHRIFWRETLQGIEGLPTFSYPNSSFSHVQQKLSLGLSGDLDKLAEQEGVSSASIFQVALGFLLGRLKGDQEALIGVAVSGRAVPVADVEKVVGLCANTCPFPVRWNDSESLNKVLQRVHTLKLRLLPFEHVPVNLIREWLEIDTDRSLFQCLFAFGNYPLEQWQGQRCRISNYQGATTSTLPLTLSVVPGDTYLLDWLAHPGLAGVLPWIEQNMEILIRGFVQNSTRDVAGLLSAATPVPKDCRNVFGASASLPTKGQGSDRSVDRVEDFVLRIWEDIFGEGKVGVETTFGAAGGTSLHAAELTTRIGRRFAMRIPLDFVFKAPTVKAMADAIRRGADVLEWPIVVPVRRAGTRSPLFLVHGLGGGVFNYYDWKKNLPDDQPLYALQAPLKPLNDLRGIARLYIEEMKKFQSSGPYRLGGFCFGAVVAFEMTCQLEAVNEKVEYLGVVDAGIPEFLPNLSQKMKARLSMYGWKSFMNTVAKGSARLGERLWRRFTDRGEWFQMDDVIDVANYPEAYREVAATHFQALSEYKPDRKCHAPLHLVRSNSTLATADPTLGWDKATDTIDIDVVNCEHHEIVHSDRVEEVVEKIAAVLEYRESG